MKRFLASGLLLGLIACGEKPTLKAPPSAPVFVTSGAPWTWHPLGGLAVVEGELAEGAELVLEGPSLHEKRYAEPGPLRWEFFRPPEGEAAVLRTAEGKELARFQFSLRPAKPAPVPKVARAKPTPQPVPSLRSSPTPKAPPAKLPPPAKAVATTRSAPRPVPPLAPRVSPALPALPPATPVASAPVQPLVLTPPPPARIQAHAPPVTPQGSPWPGMGEGLNLTRGPGGRKRLLVSFDGGSTSEVATEVLDTLKVRGVRTTIFLTGAFIQRYPVLVKRMAAEGHELGNHTMNHPHFAPNLRRDPNWTRERVQRELLEADAALLRLLGRPMDPYWRAPYGEHTAEIRRWAEELGYRHVGWSEGADTLDWATPKERKLYRSGDAILQRLQQRLNRDGDGLIVLMHLGSERVERDRPSTGLGAFMDRAKREGWTFVSAGTFLRDLGKPAWDPQQRLARLAPSASGASAP
jgi:peptidoglycan/xylan/chitin deacetylase (PgdA/CDA1 family)